MLVFILLILTSAILVGLFQRYVPVFGVPKLAMEDGPKNEDITYLDVRDYNIADQHPIEGVFQLPYAYLKRHHGEIRKKDIIVVASDQLLLNLSVRFLRKKGFNVVGCYMTESEKFAAEPSFLKKQKRVQC